jgi:hypothetical protein
VDIANAYFDFSEGRLDRGGAVRVGDCGGSTSDEAAAADADRLVAARPAVATADDDGDDTFEENVIFEGRPFVHGWALWIGVVGLM